MASGMTTTGSLADSLPTLIASARIVREFEGVMPQLVDKVTLGEGTGNNWNEISLSQLTAQAVSETEELENPQQLADTLSTITPTVVGIQIRITDKVAARISSNVYARIGALAQNAIQRKKDEDGITALDSGSSASDPGAGATLTSSHIASAKVNISSNTTEPGPPPYRCVLHGFQMKDLFDELVAGVGAYVLTEGPTARVFATGFNLPIAGVEVYEDGNIPIDSSDDAKGGVFSQQGIVMVQGRAPRVVAVRKENVGGGATDLFHYDEYAYGIRSSTRWVFEMESDATAPTS
uniref:Putative capsid protein n=1 Tax=viral metagenome TaxID=1070528 RepID=A0A6M3LEU3_9ZZZZ